MVEKSSSSTIGEESNFLKNKCSNLKRANGNVFSEVKNNCNSPSRPPFITTVKRGKFLPSKFDLLLERNFFTFSSRPKPVSISIKHQSHSSPGSRSKIEPDISLPRGVHDYFNIMWDPHVIRGSTAKVQAKYYETDQSRSMTIVEESRVRKKRESNVMRTRVRMRETPPISQNSNIFNNSLSSSVVNRLSTMVQTEDYLEELPSHQNSETILSSDASVQTDSLLFTTLFNDEITIPSKSGLDVGTQILPGDLFDFETEVQPILDSLVGKVLEQAMFEVVEEEEVLSLKEQKYKFQEKRRHEEKELFMLQREQEKINIAKERLKKQLETEQVFVSESGNDGAYSTSYLLELLPSVLNSIRQELSTSPTHPTNELNNGFAESEPADSLQI